MDEKYYNWIHFSDVEEDDEDRISSLAQEIEDGVGEGQPL